MVKKISGRVIFIGTVGNEYNTFEKTIDGYYLVRVDGETTGQYIEGEIEVYYYYESTEGTGNTDVEPEPTKTAVAGVSSEVKPPRTRVDNSIAIVYAVVASLISAMIYFKKRED